MICVTAAVKTIVLSISLIGGILNYMLIMITIRHNLKFLRNYKFLTMSRSMWFISFLRTKSISRGYLVRVAGIEVAVDKEWYEHFGGQGLHYLFSNLSTTFWYAMPMIYMCFKRKSKRF